MSLLLVSSLLKRYDFSENDIINFDLTKIEPSKIVEIYDWIFTIEPEFRNLRNVVNNLVVRLRMLGIL